MASPRSPTGSYFDHSHREAQILSKHLDSSYTGGFHDQRGNESGNEREDAFSVDAGQESSLRLQGGDVHRDLYRIEARSKRARLEQRAATFSHPIISHQDELDGDVPADQPGGFRRQFLQRNHRRFHSVTTPITHNFVSFLELYGSFAGEDLAESDDESALETGDEEVEGERRPLLPRRRSTRLADRGDASNVKSFFTLLKAFVGTGIMFLPKAFKNGGMLFSAITLVSVSLVTCICFHLLLQLRKRYGGSYGDIGETLGGKRFRSLILISIAVSQIGFVCAGMIFVAENLFSFANAVSPNHDNPISTTSLIAVQVLLLVPLAFIRNISKLGPAALLADAFILLGLVYIYSYDISSMVARHGLHPTVELFNPKDFTLTIGSAIFTFEGIGLILPIQSSMKRPEHFSFLLYVVMFIITVVFTAVGVLSYGTFGSETRTEIISNFPQSSKLVNAVQFLYSLAVLIGTPVQLFPPVRIMEGKLFKHKSGKRDPSIKWKKNVFRTFVVVVCAIIAALGAGDLDKFVALIGAFACVPLVYIYPAYLHYKGIASSRIVVIGDIVMMVLGAICMVYTTCITIKIWVES